MAARHEHHDETWTFAGIDEVGYLHVDVDDTAGTVTLDHGMFQMLAVKAGMSMTSEVPEDARTLDLDNPVLPAGAGNQRFGEPNRVEPSAADEPADDPSEEGAEPSGEDEADGQPGEQT